jgi:von Willebrand factor type D domain
MRPAAHRAPIRWALITAGTAALLAAAAPTAALAAPAAIPHAPGGAAAPGDTASTIPNGTAPASPATSPANPGTASANPGTASASPGGAPAGTMRAVLRSAGGVPVLTLTNRGPAECAVAATAVGTVQVTGATAAGRSLTARSATIRGSDDLGYQLAKTARPLAPGASIDLPLQVLEAGGKPALSAVALAHATASTVWLFPADTGTELDVTLSYALPVAPATGTACPAATATGALRLAAPTTRPGTATGATTHRRLPLYAGAALLVVGLGGLAVVAVAVRRRSRAGQAAVVVLLLAGLVAVAAPRPAHADLSNSVAVDNAFGTCLEVFAKNDPAGILPTILGNKSHIRVVPYTDYPNGGPLPGPYVNPDVNFEFVESPGNIVISWDPQGPTLEGPPFDMNPCTVLYHELFHAFEDTNGNLDYTDCYSGGRNTHIPVAEVAAMRAENKLRVALKLPVATYYGADKLPKGNCGPKPKGGKGKPHPRCSSTCGRTTADPHLLTIDGRAYDFQAAGEFVASADPAGGWEIQARQIPIAPSRWAAANRAVAMRVGPARVELRQDPERLDQPTLLVDGKPRPLAGTVALPGGGSVTVTDDDPYPTPYVTTRWADGSQVFTTFHGSITIQVDPAAARRGRLTGLLGDGNGNAHDDLRVRGGAALPDRVRPTYDELYPRYADSWRVRADSSLFTYPPGVSTGTFTQRAFPDRPPALAQLPGRAAAEQVCRAAGVTGGQALADCTFDVAVTGSADFAVAAADVQAFEGNLAIGGPPVDVPVPAPGSVDRVTFAGRAGQRVTIVAAAPNAKIDCGALRLLDPGGATISSGCLGGTSGQIGPVDLSGDGTYTVEVRPTDAATGTITLTALAAQDSADLRVDGPAVTARIVRVGDSVRYRMPVRAGQRLYLAVQTPGMPIDCGALRVVDPSGSAHDGCLNTGSGEVPPFTVPTAGTLTVLLDPGREITGTATLRLSTVTDHSGRISLGGPAVTAEVDNPAAVVRVAFDGRAGQRVTVEATTTDLVLGCGGAALVDPAGRTVASGCLLSSKHGGIDPVTLKTTGTYTIEVDAPYAATGSIQLRLLPG